LDEYVPNERINGYLYSHCSHFQRGHLWKRDGGMGESTCNFVMMNVKMVRTMHMNVMERLQLIVYSLMKSLFELNLPAKKEVLRRSWHIGNSRLGESIGKSDMVPLSNIANHFVARYYLNSICEVVV